MEREKEHEEIKKAVIDKNLFESTLKGIETERFSRIYTKLKRKSLFIFDIKNSKNNFKNNRFLTNTIRSSEEILSLPFLFNDECDIVKDLELNENTKSQEKENDKNNIQENEQLKQISEVEAKKQDYLNHNLNKETFKRKYRIKLRSERLLDDEIKSFFDNQNEINSNSFLNFDNLVSFYDFDLDKYYSMENNIVKTDKKLMIFKSHIFDIQNKEGCSNCSISNNANNNINSTCNTSNFENMDKNKFDSNINMSSHNNNDSNIKNNTTNKNVYDSLIFEVLEKVRSYLKLDNLSAKIRKLILNLILNSIVILKTSLIQWLLSQILNNSDNNSTFISKNNLFPEWVDLNDKYLNGSNIFNNDNNLELSDEAIAKFLDYIDPQEESVTNKFLTCEFCGRNGARRLSGRLINLKNETWAHVNCAVRSKGVFETAEGNLLNVQQILNKVKNFKCFLCRKTGATITCEFKKCGKNYHFICALVKQSVFTKSGKFYCLKCSNSKEEILTNYDTKRRIVVIKNVEFISDWRINYLIDYNFNKILPKYLIGSVVKFGNTAILKFFNLNKKDLNIDNYDINIIKLVDEFNEISTQKEKDKDPLLGLLKASHSNNNDIIISNALEKTNVIDIKDKRFDSAEDIEIEGDNNKNVNQQSGEDNNLNKNNRIENDKEVFNEIDINIEINNNENINSVKFNEISSLNNNNYKNNNQLSDTDKIPIEDNLNPEAIVNGNGQTVINEVKPASDAFEANVNSRDSWIINNKIINKKFLLVQVNETGVCLTEFENISLKVFEALISKYKILNHFEKSDFILNIENHNLIDEFNNPLEPESLPCNNKIIKQVLNIQTDKIITLNPNKDNFEALMKNTINKFNGKFFFSCP